MKLMKFFIMLAIFVLNMSWASVKSFDVIFDLDGTLFHHVYSKQSEYTIRASDNKLYEPIKWGREGIENLLAQGYRIHFYSGGLHHRNLSLLKQTYLDNGKSLFDIASSIHSKNDMEVISTQGRYADRFKKNLIKRGFDLNKSIIIDDIERFVPVNQIDNMLWTGQTYYHFNSFEIAEKHRNDLRYKPEYIPETELKWKISINKMKFIMELLLDAKENASSNEEILNYIRKYKTKYIPYNEELSSFQKILLTKNKVPSICFRKFQNFINP